MIGGGGGGGGGGSGGGGGGGGIIGGIIHTEVAKRAEERQRAECLRQRGIRQDSKQKGSDGMNLIWKLKDRAEDGSLSATVALVAGAACALSSYIGAAMVLSDLTGIGFGVFMGGGLGALAFFAGRYALRDKGDD